MSTLSLSLGGYATMDQKCHYRIGRGRTDVLPGMPVGLATYHVYLEGPPTAKSPPRPWPSLNIIWTGTWGECVEFIKEHSYSIARRAAEADGADPVEANERAESARASALADVLRQRRQEHEEREARAGCPGCASEMQ